MKFQVDIYYDGVLIDPSKLSSLVIVSPTVQRIVNRVIRRCEEALLVEEADNHSSSANEGQTDLLEKGEADQTTVRESWENKENPDEPAL